MLNKSPMVGAAKAEPSDVNQKVIYLQALGCVAVNCWPSMNLAKKSEVGPSQWQIIGDYLESLMQVYDDFLQPDWEVFVIMVSYTFLCPGWGIV